MGRFTRFSGLPILYNRKGPALCADPLVNLTLWFGLFRSFGDWQNRDKGSSLETLVEVHSAIDGRKDRVILAHADALARPELGAALTHNDVSGVCGFAPIEFDAQTATC
jgi:hypothetical protein